jgi:peroxiredoxin
VVVSPQTEKRNESIQRQKQLGFDVLSDPGNQLADRFGLRFQLSGELRDVYQNTFKLNLPAFNGDDSWTLPMPARYVIDSGSKIRYAAMDPDYTARPEPALTVEALQAIAG